MIDRNFAIDDFAYRCFRDTADEDYMAARMAFHAGIEGTSTWLSHQAIEKWLKCILLLNRIPATTIGHDLQKAIELLDTFDIRLGLTERTQELISYLDQYG